MSADETVCRYCGNRIEYATIDVVWRTQPIGPMWIHTVSRSSHCTLYAAPK